MRGGRIVIGMCVMLLLPSGRASRAEPGRRPARGTAAAATTDGGLQDAYLRGYIASLLDTLLPRRPEGITIEVVRGVVTLTGELETPEEIGRVVAAVASVDGVDSLINHLVVAAGGGRRYRTWTDWMQPPAGRRSIRFPQGDLFTAPLADQRQPRFHITWQRWHTDAGSFHIASVGFGENFGIVRWPRGREGDGWQLGMSGAVFAIFNLGTSSVDLLNADYYVGFPLSYRSGRWSARLRPFHQSAHLGDEFLLQTGDTQPVPPVTRINLSYEALEFLTSYERDGGRIYFGGTRIVTIDPSGFGRNRLQTGLEYHGNPLGWRTARLVAGLDLEAWNETDWDRDWSFKTGMMLRSPYGDARSVEFLLEYYHGHAPYGQFFPVKVEYAGLGVAYAF